MLGSRQLHLTGGGHGPARLVLALAAVLFGPSLAQAQLLRPPAGLRDALQPDFVRRDLGTMSDVLGLDENQGSIVVALFEDYSTGFEDGVRQLRIDLGNARPDMTVVQRQIRDERLEIDAQMRAIQDEIQRRFQAIKDRAKRRDIMEEFRGRQLELKDRMSRYDSGSSVAPAMLESMRHMENLVSVWTAEKSALREAFVTNVQAILADEQLQRWPAFERRLRREKSLPRGQLSGESIDLLLLVRSLDLSPDELQPVVTLLEEYDLLLDQQLVARDRFLDEQRDLSVLEIEDPGTALATRREEVRLRVAVRDVNLEYANLVVASLSPDPSSELLQAYRVRAFPRIFRPSPILRMLDAAVLRTDIEADVLDSLAKMRDVYVEESEAMSLQVESATVTHEPLQLVKRHDRRVGSRELSFERAADPISLAISSREDLDRRYAQILSELLPPAIIAQLPGSSDPTLRSVPGARGSGLANQQEIMQRFDEDGDGSLNPHEREKVRAYLREQAHRNRE